MLRMLTACVAAGLMAAAGCKAQERPVEPEKAPTVTLTSRTQDAQDKMDEIDLTFTFTNMDRADWHGMSLHAAIVKSGEKPSGPGADLTGMPADVTFMLNVCKSPTGDTVTFTPMWSTPAVGETPAQIASPELPSPSGGNNEAVLSPKDADHRLTQVLTTCVGPGNSIPFDPAKGIDLVTVGYAPDSYSVHFWIDRSSAK